MVHFGKHTTVVRLIIRHFDILHLSTKWFLWMCVFVCMWECTVHIITDKSPSYGILLTTDPTTCVLDGQSFIWTDRFERMEWTGGNYRSKMLLLFTPFTFGVDCLTAVLHTCTHAQTHTHACTHACRNILDK